MAAPLKGRRWALVAVLAMAALVTAALLAPDRGQQLQDYQASGPLRQVPAEQVQRVTLAGMTGQWQLRRQGSGWVAEPALPASAAALAERVDMGLRLLRNSAIERELEQASPDFGLGAQALRVEVYTDAAGPVLQVTFGASNPVGLARYTQLVAAGQTQTVLLPGYVAEAWEAVLK